MPARFRSTFRPTDRKEAWTPTGWEIQANITERHRQIMPYIRNGEQLTLDRFEAKGTTYLFAQAEQILSLA